MRYLFVIIGLICLSWFDALPRDNQSLNLHFWLMASLLLIKGLMIWLMSCLILMANRPHWLEQRLGGLHRMSRIQRWTGGSLRLLFFLFSVLLVVPLFLAGYESDMRWTKQVRFMADSSHSWTRIASDLSEYGVYAMMIMLSFSLINVLPYRQFRFIHKLGAGFIMMAALHSYFLLPDTLLWSPFGAIVLLGIIAGILAAGWALTGKQGRLHRYQGEIAFIRPHTVDVMELGIRLPTGFNDEYLPGQFALLTLDENQPAHPFTVIREDLQHDIVVFAVKAQSKFTHQLLDQVELNKSVTVEGPYGRFIMPDSGPQEYWIARDIGITPFMAWLEGLVAEGERRPGAELYYCVNSEQDVLFADRLTALTETTGVKLNILRDDQEGLLDPSELSLDEDTRVWFCGPEPMRERLLKHIPASQLHYEKLEIS